MRLIYIVPTLGQSPWLDECLEALRHDAGEGDQIWVVDQGAQPTQPKACDRVLRFADNQGFAGGCNRALAESRASFVALINDDALIAPGWTDVLLQLLADAPQAAAAQGLNLMLADPMQVDGGGIAWNRWWQAVQLGHGRPSHEMSSAPIEIFGVSATAAIYRADALRQVALDDGSIFDPRLFAYYEDVDLAVRLRAAGFTAWRGTTTARHAGSVTGGRRPDAKVRWLTRNRLWVVARLLGRDLPRQLPTLRRRELLDLGHDLSVLELRSAAARVAGWREAQRRLDEFAHDRPSLLSPAEIEDLREGAA